jgi:RNA polymerase sigma-70 factor (ECF subfamily)
MQDEQDAQMAARAARGDGAAFEGLVTRYEAPLFRVAFRMLGDYDDARDATQTAFIKAYEKLGTFDPRFKFFSWIYRILLNECLNARRSRQPREALTADLPATGTPVDRLEAEDRRRMVQQALLALPDDYRQVIVLRHFGELNYDEIASTLGIPAKTVKSRLYTARQRLMEFLTAKNS